MENKCFQLCNKICFGLIKSVNILQKFFFDWSIKKKEDNFEYSKKEIEVHIFHGITLNWKLTWWFRIWFWCVFLRKTENWMIPSKALMMLFILKCPRRYIPTPTYLSYYLLALQNFVHDAASQTMGSKTFWEHIPKFSGP